MLGFSVSLSVRAVVERCTLYMRWSGRDNVLGTEDGSDGYLGILASLGTYMSDYTVQVQDLDMSRREKQVPGTWLTGTFGCTYGGLTV